MSNYNSGRIRKLLSNSFNDKEFTIFCYDNFREVYNDFSDGLLVSDKIQLLIDYCDRRNLFSQLLALVKEANPTRYAEYELGQAGANPSPQIVPAPPPQPATTTSTAVVDNSGERPDVFISYSRRDNEQSGIVDKLYQELTGRGISTWYDKRDIHTGIHWPSQIVKGIRECKVFMIVLSPDSAQSDNVRKEVDLAQRYDRKIVPLIWRPTPIPEAMEYQLAGIQWIQFNEVASQDKFNQLADVLNNLIRGSSMTEATVNTQIVIESPIPAIPKAGAVSATPRPTIGGVSRGQTLSPTAIRGAVISSVVTTFNLNTEKDDAGISEKDRVNEELKWLFGAVDNFLRIKKGTISSSQPIDAPIPPYAEKQPQANNHLLSNVDSFSMGIWGGTIESGLKRIDIHLRNLDILLKQEANKGQDAVGDVYLQNQLKGARIEIVKILQEMAELMNQAYGILIISPEELVIWLEQQRAF